MNNESGAAQKRTLWQTDKNFDFTHSRLLILFVSTQKRRWGTHVFWQISEFLGYTRAFSGTQKKSL